MRLLSLLFLILWFSSCTEKNVSALDQDPLEIIACGDENVVIFDRVKSYEDSLVKVWEWSASISEGLPEEFHAYFNSTDDCKPVGENQFLITSSSGGVALVNRKDKKTVFYARVPNAHSAEFLPGGRIVVALSTAENGNAIRLYDVDQPDEILFSDSLYSGHGAVWDEEKNSLFALGFDQLREYKLSDWESAQPKLAKVNEWEIPDESGHDLFLTSDRRLLLTTTNSVWQFDISTSLFTPFEPLEGIGHVKSVNYNAETEALVYTKGEISWWTHHIYFSNPKDTLVVNDMKLYKVRVL
ncbi:DUF6528 family protein [uncultured Cyclobacterium sp.]|uniref:DUF6528 family protein n=1 Tax=uncultured Cyclobacterium sp. TaxID=453820 RepID=UPI0030ED9C12|tara:strand:+ start:7325 stop:8218 length:894 start_codon:yes stop_codon:yes gene_type:complete